MATAGGASSSAAVTTTKAIMNLTEAAEQCRQALDEERDTRKQAFVAYLSKLPSHLIEMDSRKTSQLFPYNPGEVYAMFTSFLTKPNQDYTQNTNPVIQKIIEELRVEIHISLKQLANVREFVTLSLPKHESGNVLGVSVMEFVIKSIDASLEKLSAYATDLPEYFQKRAESLDRITMEDIEENETLVTKEDTKYGHSKTNGVDEDSEVKMNDKENDEEKDEKKKDDAKKDENKTVTKEEKSIVKRFTKFNVDFKAYIVAYDVEWYCQLGRVWDEVRSIHACVTDLITKNIKYVVDPKNDHGSSGHMMY